MLRSPTPATAKVAVAGDPGSAQHDSTESVLRYAQDHTHEGLIMRDRFGALTENYPTLAHHPSELCSPGTPMGGTWGTVEPNRSDPIAAYSETDPLSVP